MKNFVVLTVALLASMVVYSQTTPRIQKNTIEGCGCSVYMPGNAEFSKSYSEDSSEVFTGEIKDGKHYFSVIAVKFKTPVGNHKGDNSDLLKSYLNFLKGEYGVTAAVGFGEGHTMESNSNAIGILDYWEDEQEYQFVVKGWIDSNKMAVLVVYGPGEYPIFNIQQLFLDGFRFE